MFKKFFSGKKTKSALISAMGKNEMKHVIGGAGTATQTSDPLGTTSVATVKSNVRNN
jgi:hypothetical protein